MPDFDSAVEQTDLLQELIEKAESVATMQRDPSIPAGTVLGESDVYGAIHREVMPNSLVRAGKVPLPERFEAWDVYGNPSMLPTGQMARMLSKPNAEMPTVKAFHTHRKDVTRDNCTICPPTKKPYSGSCQWCAERTAGKVDKKFKDQTEQEGHFEYYHPREWAALQRQLDRDERKASLKVQEDLAKAMLQAVNGRKGRGE
jgi:hypothetical protein